MLPDCAKQKALLSHLKPSFTSEKFYSIALNALNTSQLELVVSFLDLSIQVTTYPPLLCEPVS